MQPPKRAKSIISPQMREKINAKLLQQENEGQKHVDPEKQKTEASPIRTIKRPQAHSDSITQAYQSVCPVPPKAPPFEDRYHRVTTYLEIELHDRLQQIRRAGHIASITALYNAALKEYLNKYYGKNEQKN